MTSPKPLLKQENFSDLLPLGSKQRSEMRSKFQPRIAHGGVPSIHKRKTPRPFSPKAPVHLVLHSSRAKGLWSLRHRKNQAKINAMIYTYAARFKVEVFQAKTLGRELHLLVRAKEKKHLADYLRVLAGRMAITISGAKKYVKRIGKFWDYLYWSKLVNWGSQFFQVRDFIQNLNESASGALSTKEWALPAKPT